MRGAGSKDILSNGPERNDLANDKWSSANDLDCTTSADIQVEMPLACLGILEGTPPLEPPSSGRTAISVVVGLPIFTQDVVPGSPDGIQTLVGDKPCDATCMITLSPPPGSPAKGVPPPNPAAPGLPAPPVKPPSWADPQSMGEAQHAPEIHTPTGALAAPAGSPTTPLEQALLPRVPAAPTASQPRRGFTQCNRAKVAVSGANYTGLVAQKAALERELVTLLNRHERLSRGLPWHMQHEEVSFMASIARCVAAGRPCALPERPESNLEPSEGLIQNLMLDPCATMNGVYQAAGIGLAFPTGGEQPVGSEDLNIVPEKAGSKGPVWSSIVTFLKLSKQQKDKLAAAYGSHIQRAAAVRRECLAIGTKLQAEDVLKPNLATHLACGHLTGIAKEEKDLVLFLNKECYEVLNQVQSNNLLALAPARSAAALGLCREVAAQGSTAATTGSGKPLAERQQNATRPVDASLHALAGANNATGDAHGTTDVSIDIFPDAAALVANADAADAPRNASAQTAHTKQAGALAKMTAAGANSSRRRKRQMVDHSLDSEGCRAPKAQSTAATPGAAATPTSTSPPPTN